MKREETATPAYIYSYTYIYKNVLLSKREKTEKKSKTESIKYAKRGTSIVFVYESSLWV